MANNATARDFQDCVDISPECPLEATVLAYYPSLAANVFFLVWFAIFFIANAGLGIYYKTWTYMLAMLLGCGTEVLGYAGRIIMHYNPWAPAGFNMQITCLIIAPAFLSAAIYLTLKHIVIAFGSQHSLLKPAWYTYVFITCDLIALTLQGAGGGTAATADRGSSAQDLGSNLMLGGIVFQVLTLVTFAGLVVLYLGKLRKSTVPLEGASAPYRKSLSFQLFCAGVLTAYVMILIRCIYRIPEQAGGWQNDLQQNERDFIILEGAVIAVAVAAQTFFHPGFGFPQMVPGAIDRKSEDSLEK